MKDILMIALSFLLIANNIFRNRGTLKKLTKIQVLGVGISYLIAIIAAFIFVYYGGNWIAGQFSNSVLKYIISFAVVCFVLYFCVSILNKMLQKVTNGILPKDK
ncbi:hypothetical protein ACTHOQ_07860 [Solibacillus silvestris]|uniref:hypothetical protein n=1 Tax=Solibacillus silvestris TaxID=76853 RepID=UPI003F7EF88C